jgi:hypothetical protein
MREDLLYFVWKFKLYKDFKIFDHEYKQIKVLNPGIQNYNSGPDFTGAQIKADEVTWVGNIEIDIKSSDWYRHGHHVNKDFNNVVIEVVNVYDKNVISENGRKVSVIEIKIEPEILNKYTDFLENKTFIPCSSDIKDVDPVKMQLWLGNVLVERLRAKSEYISGILKSNKNSWEDTFYQLLARSFGFNVNSDPFEWLAKSLPLKYLAKHHKNIIQLEALLFGQAGFLFDNIIENQYHKDLKKEYQFLKTKYQLIPIEKHLWKFMRIRPSNFPTIRISQFANQIFKSHSLFSKIIHENSLDNIRQLFDIEASEFWNNHYNFDSQSNFKKKSLGEESIDKILINTVIPIIFVYGESTNNESLKERAINFLENIIPERNNIIDKWKDLGVKIPSAFYSQALLNQKKEYCTHGRCLECGIGIEILKNQFYHSNDK